MSLYGVFRTAGLTTSCQHDAVKEAQIEKLDHIRCKSVPTSEVCRESLRIHNHIYIHECHPWIRTEVNINHKLQLSDELDCCNASSK